MTKMARTLACLSFFLSVSGAFGAGRAPVISTTHGPIRGVIAHGVASYLGIPYAKAPLGSLRWRAPQPPDAWKEVRDTSHFGASCYQGPPVPWGPFTAEFLVPAPVSENCLFLNVWTPETRKSSLPVYVFVYGGGFGSGSTSVPVYDGANLASRGVVVVTMNYRVGVFGFLALPELTKESKTKSSGNYGLEDVIAALRWVHANAARFGGNPRLVTVAGQSAGAEVVNDLLVSKPARGLFERAIAESGSGMGIPVPTLAEAERQGVAFEKAAGASNLAQLRAMSAADLLKLTSGAPPKPGKGNLAPELEFLPNMDGAVIATFPSADAPLQSNVPLLTGYNSDEGEIFGPVRVTPQEFEREVRRRYAGFADRFLALYPHATTREASASAAMLARDRYMASLLTFSQQRTRSSGEVIFPYLYDHPYPDPDSQKFGAFHTAEVPYVFGALKQRGRVFNAEDFRVSRQLQDYWINFIITGDPNGAGLPHWPQARGSGGFVMGLGDHLGARPAVSSRRRLDLFEDYVEHGHTLSLM